MAKRNFVFVRSTGSRLVLDNAISQLLFDMDVCDGVFYRTKDVVVNYIIPKMNEGDDFRDIRNLIIVKMTNAYCTMKNALDGSAEQDSLRNDWMEWRFKFQTMNLLEMWGFRVRLAHVEEDLPPTA
jgi:hypothetical protein